MDKLSIRKQLTIIRLYYSGLSYREIAVKAGVSTGAVANVIGDLRAGSYPEVGDVAEQVDVIKGLAMEVRKSKLTLGEAATGITAINSLKELGLEPSDIPQCVTLFKEIAPRGVETQTFVKAAMEYDQVLRRTGLSVDDMEKKMKHLEEVSSQLEPMAAKTVNLKKEIKVLEAKKVSLAEEVTELNNRQHTFAERVKEMEERETSLSDRIVQLESKLQTDEEKLAVARKDLNILSSLGITFNELSGIIERIKGVAHRHNIDPKLLYNRLLTEIEHMDKGLSLETLIEQRNNKLQKVESAILKAQEKSMTLGNQN